MWFYRILFKHLQQSTPGFVLICFFVQKVSLKHLLLHWYVKPTSTSLQGPKPCWCENLWVFAVGCSQRRAGAVCDTWGNKPFCVQRMFSCAEIQESGLTCQIRNIFYDFCPRRGSFSQPCLAAVWGLKWHLGSAQASQCPQGREHFTPEHLCHPGHPACIPWHGVTPLCSLTGKQFTAIYYKSS